jgi:glycosyltransferase involved in cell wall biosynthesis
MTRGETTGIVRAGGHEASGKSGSGRLGDEMVMKRPEMVSVVIPSYNHAPYLRAAVESVLAQTRVPDEIILVDDGSRDNSVELARELARQAPLLKVFTQRNQGAHAALNRGVREAAGPYVAVLNSDDVFPVQKLERCLKLVRKRPPMEFIAGRVAIIDEAGVRQEQGIAVDWQKRSLDFLRQAGQLPLAVMNENFLTTTSNFFFTKKLWEAVGGFQPLRYCHDLDFALTALKRGQGYFDEAYEHILYRVHPRNTIAEDLKKIRVEIAGVLAVHLVEFGTALWPRHTPAELAHFQTFLRNKNLDAALIAMMLKYLETRKRDEFYAHLAQPKNRDFYLGLVV